MPNQQFHNEFHRLANILVERGFAKTVYYDSEKNVAVAVWTDDGIALQGLLRRLFDVPKVRMLDLTDREVANLIQVTLATTTRGPVR
jgi:hypothetical protein